MPRSLYVPSSGRFICVSVSSSPVTLCVFACVSPYSPALPQSLYSAPIHPSSCHLSHHRHLIGYVKHNLKAPLSLRGPWEALFASVSQMPRALGVGR